MMKKAYTIYIITLALFTTLTVSAQERVVENRPYTDLRPLHLGIVVGTHLQDLEFENVGAQTLTLNDGSQMPSLVTCDQHNWDIGFNVGVLAELRLNQYFAFRAAAQMYFGNRNLMFYNYNKQDADGSVHQEKENLKSVYIGADLDLIYAAKRFNNHRPYIMAGLCPVWNLSSKSSDYVQLKGSDVFFEVGLGCDFYLPFFKLRPELKFMLGLTDCFKKDHINLLEDESMLPYAASVNSAKSKMIVLSFYFE